jgi:hypothetical protein
MLVILVVGSLALSVATRFCVPSLITPSSAKTVAARSVAPKCQHLDRDATHWVTPASSFSFIDTVRVEHRLTPVQSPLPRIAFCDSLYNRPPPAALFLA